jgi:hypothetical protein
LNFGKPAARFDGFSFLLHRRLLVGPAKLQLFEQAAFGQLVLEDLQGLFDVIVKYSDFQFSPLPSLVYLFIFCGAGLFRAAGIKKGQYGVAQKMRRNLPCLLACF